MHHSSTSRPLVAFALVALAALVPAAAQETSIESGELRLLGSRLHFLQAGHGHNPTVLLLHGARFSAATWQELGTLTFLAGKGYRVLALDLPGYGDSEPSDTPPADLLTTLLPLISDGPVIVVSPSMSGVYSLPLLARRPGYVAGFVAVAPVGIPEFLSQVEGQETPALLVWGSDDTVIPKDHAKRLAKALPNSRRVVLEGAGHACYLARPEDFHRELVAFIESLQGGSESAERSPEG